MAGAMNSSGATLRSAAPAAKAWRICSGWATWMTRSRVATLKVRQVLPLTVMSASPSRARVGRSSRNLGG